MATSENGVQAELVADWNKAGGHAIKMSNAYTTGVPDLLVQPKTTSHLLAPMFKFELKFIKPDKKTRGLTKALSTPQEDHLRKTSSAGGIGVWGIAYTFTDSKRWGLFMLHSSLSVAHTVTREDMDDETNPAHFLKPLGGRWPVDDIAAFVYQAEDGRRDLYANWKEG